MGTPESGILDRSYRPDIDGLRCIAILSVVLYHAGVPLITGGFTGVDIFFVISGYLIGGHIYSELRIGDFSYIRFYYRRAKRILPAFYTVLGFTMLAALLLLSPSEATEFGRSAFAATLSSSNILFWKTTNYFNPSNEFNPLLMTWSLGVEEQFYVLIPVIMAILAHMRRKVLLPAILAVCAISFIFAWRVLAIHPIFVFFMLPARIWELGVGVGLAVSELNSDLNALPPFIARTLSVIGVTLMLAPVFLLKNTTLFPGAAALPSVLGTAMVLASRISWINRQFLSFSPFVFIGKVSYSWYLWHWPLLAFAHILYGGELEPIVSAMVVASSFVAAVLSYILVEQPLRRSSRAPIPLLRRYFALSVAILAACAVLWLSRGVPQRLPSLAAIESQVKDQSVLNDSCMVRDGQNEPNQSPTCFEISASRPDIALWGDSHSAALVPGIRDSGRARGYGLVELTKTDCPPLIGVHIYSPQYPLEEEACFQFNRNVLNLLKANPNVRIVILASFWELPFSLRTPGHGNARWYLSSESAKDHEAPPLDASRRLMKQSIATTIKSLQEAGKEVLVFEDVPTFEINPVSRVRTASIPVRHALAVWLRTADASDPGFAHPYLIPEAALASSALKEAVAEFSNVVLVDLVQEICRGAADCYYRDRSRLLYSDTDHLTADGARYALRDFRLPTLAEVGK